MALQHKQVLTALFFVVGTGFISVSEAALYDRGNGLIYDDVLNVTWLQDTNLFKAQATNDANLVNEIVTNIGTITSNGGVHTLTADDFNANTGAMTWYGAQAWASNLNYSGYTDWRLPANPSHFGYGYYNYNQYHFNNADTRGRESHYYDTFVSKSNELPYLYGEELGNNPCPWCDFTLKNNLIYRSNMGDITASFSNLPSMYTGSYWLADEEIRFPGTALTYRLYWRDVSYNSMNDMSFAWAVRSGDVTAVPVPAAFWLFISGLMSLRFSFRTLKLRPRAI